MIEPGSCFTGTLLELALAADRSYMLDGALEGDNRPPATLRPTSMNFGAYPMPNGLSRLETRFLDAPDRVAAIEAKTGEDIDAHGAEELGLVTFAPDDLDWEDEIRIAIEERASFSPDALTGMEASLRFAGPETIETKIFGRLSAWQNWIFQRPNAVGEDGALRLFGTGRQAKFDAGRVWTVAVRSNANPVDRQPCRPGVSREHRLSRDHPQQRQFGRGPPPAARAGEMAARISRLVARHGARGKLGDGGLSAHRD